TLVVMGAVKGEADVFGSIPLDLVTLGFMQASWFGIPVVGILFGLMLRLFQNKIDKINHKGVKSVLIAYVAIKISIFAVFYSHPYQFISGNFPFFFSLCIIYFCFKFSKLRVHK